jgi:hypothetical protein
MNLFWFQVAFPISFLSSLCMYAQVREVKGGSDVERERDAPRHKTSSLATRKFVKS